MSLFVKLATVTLFGGFSVLALAGDRQCPVSTYMFCAQIGVSTDPNAIPYALKLVAVGESGATLWEKDLQSFYYPVKDTSGRVISPREQCSMAN